MLMLNQIDGSVGYVQFNLRINETGVDDVIG